uniref:Uncharacterized protein n=1 Tax=Tanacetum cinerariifolium TaxID=118510 RepID=A0A6L2N5J6_TANCI|nr:hypothetical protein [Tanacetum cinerariifolium]
MNGISKRYHLVLTSQNISCRYVVYGLRFSEKVVSYEACFYLMGSKKICSDEIINFGGKKMRSFEQKNNNNRYPHKIRQFIFENERWLHKKIVYGPTMNDGFINKLCMVHR